MLLCISGLTSDFSIHPTIECVEKSIKKFVVSISLDIVSFFLNVSMEIEN